jgi:hypothetical protein
MTAVSKLASDVLMVLYVMVGRGRDKADVSCLVSS